MSSFGISGTNAHVILEQAPPAPVAPPVERRDAGALPFLLSARSDDALRAQAARLREHLGSHSELALADVAYSLAATRAQLDHRAVVIADDRQRLLDSLDAIAGGAPPRVAGIGRRSGGLAILFPGQGSQRAGAGRDLRDAFPAFRDALDEACAALDPHVALDLRRGRPLAELVVDATDPAALDATGLAQPALFALEVALFRLVQHWGIAPDVLVGHSVGEIVAAHVAGVLSLPDAAALVAARARLMQALPADGAMVSCISKPNLSEPSQPL